MLYIYIPTYLQRVISVCVVPGEPRRVRLDVINSTAVNVQWVSPNEKDQNGLIRGYQVHYIKVSESDDPLGSPGMIDTMDGTALEYVVGNLLPESSYRFQVAAYTRRGDGVRSRPRKVKTKGAGMF